MSDYPEAFLRAYPAWVPHEDGVVIRDPRAGEAFRFHPYPDSQFPAWVTRDPDEPGKYYVIVRAFLEEFQRTVPAAHKAFPVVMQMCVNSDGEIFFWPIETKNDTTS